MNYAAAWRRSTAVLPTAGPQLGQFQAGLLAALIGTELAATSGALIILFIVAVIRG